MPPPVVTSESAGEPAGENPTAVLILVGNELLSGKVQDRNGPVAIERLRQHGIELTAIEVVPDDVGRIAQALRGALALAPSAVITSGGVGPTHDDVTMRGIAEALDRPLCRHAELESRLRALFGERVNEHVLKMADLPKGAVCLPPNTSVPAVQIENVYILPGDPRLFREKLENALAAIAAGRPAAYGFVLRKLFTRCEEGEIAGLLCETQARHPTVAIGSYPRYDDRNWWTQVTFDGRDEASVLAALAEIRAAISSDRIVGEEQD